MARRWTAFLRPSTGALVAAVVVVIAACGSGAAPATTRASSVRLEHMTVGGVDRTYRVYDPGGPATSRRPLLVILHGGDEEGAAMVDRTDFDSVAGADGVVAVYPDGLDGTWNAGFCCGTRHTADDVGFLVALLDRLEADSSIDSSRVYMTGISAGGVMAYRMACDRADRVTAIASVAGTMLPDTCHPSRPVSVLEIHGTKDQEVLYDGGHAAGSSYAIPSTPVLARAWAALDGCGATAVRSGDAVVQVDTWSPCSGGTAVELETVTGGDHVWYSPGLGPADGALDATHDVWAFLSAQRR